MAMWRAEGRDPLLYCPLLYMSSGDNISHLPNPGASEVQAEKGQKTGRIPELGDKLTGASAKITIVRDERLGAYDIHPPTRPTPPTAQQTRRRPTDDS